MLFVKRQRDPVRIIRLALIAGVLMFGAVILFIHRLPTWKPVTLSPGVGYAQLVCAMAAVCIAFVMRGQVSLAADPARRDSLLLLGWVFGEGAALFGGAIFFITGDSQWYLYGLLAMTGTFVLLPARTAF